MENLLKPTPNFFWYIDVKTAFPQVPIHNFTARVPADTPTNYLCFFAARNNSYEYSTGKATILYLALFSQNT